MNRIRILLLVVFIFTSFLVEAQYIPEDFTVGDFSYAITSSNTVK